MKVFIKEAEMLTKLWHPRLARFTAVCTDREPVYVVGELAANGNLLSFLKRDAGGTKDASELVDFCRQIIEGMRYLESEGYAHASLAARNVLVDGKRRLKVADFGLRRCVVADSDGGGEDFRWIAPESYSTRQYSTQSDVWAFGVVAYEIFTGGSVPYGDVDAGDDKNTASGAVEVMRRLRDGYRLPQPPGAPDFVYKAMKSSWNWQPSQRPTFAQLSNDFTT